VNAAVEDRIVDYALRRLHGAPVDVDQADRIVDAWERGERGSDLSALVAPRPLRDSRLEAPPRRPLAWWSRPRIAIAAALVIAASASAWWFTRPSPEAPERPLARAAVPLKVLRGSHAIRTGEFLPEDVVHLVAGVPMELAHGGHLASPVAAVLEVQAQGPRLLDGRLGLEGTGEILVDAGVLRARTRGSVQATLDLAWPSEAGSNADPISEQAVERLRALRSGEGSVRIEVFRGDLIVEHRGGTERLTAGTTRRMWRVVPEQDSDADGEKKIAGWFGKLAAMTPESMELGTEEITRYFASHPARWNTLRALVLRQLSEGSMLPANFRRMVHVGLASPTGDGLAFVRALWFDHPEGFSDLEIAALAERGQFEFEREAAAMVAADDSGRPSTLAAAWLARQGDIAARAALRRDVGALRPLLNDDDFLRLAYAGFTLAELGESNAWDETIAAVRASVDAQLARNSNVTASSCVRVMLFLDRAVAESRPVPIEAFVSEWLQSLVPYPDVEAIRAAAARLGAR
jgi:hypothetical protein